MSKNYHRDVIEFLGAESTDWRALVFAIAKTNPKAVLDALGIYNWQADVVEEYRINGKVPAIKLCRNLTGKTLRESKEVVESLCEHR